METRKVWCSSLDIMQLYYFINIVECNYNLSLAAKKIHISQPALSQFISSFEKEKDVLLFNRKNGRFASLTAAGEKIYKYALEISELHEEMQEMVRIEALKQHGTIRFGVPSLILRVYFSQFFPKLSLEHPDMHIEIIEDGSNELRRMLINGEIDIAILIEPTSLDLKGYEQHVIETDEMAAFLDQAHPLNQKEKLDWEDLGEYPIATFNKNFMTYQLVESKLKQSGFDNQVQFTSSSWDYLIEATKGKSIVTILPRPVDKYIDTSTFNVKYFRDYIPFNFQICRPYKDKFNQVENFVYKEIINYFYQTI